MRYEVSGGMSRIFFRLSVDILPGACFLGWVVPWPGWPVSKPPSPKDPSRHAARLVTGWESGGRGSSRRAGPSSGRQCVFAWVGLFWLGWSRGLGTPAGGGQGCDLVIAVGNHFPLSTFHCQLSTRFLLPVCCVFRRWVGVWGERVLTSGGALLRTTVCFLGIVSVVGAGGSG